MLRDCARLGMLISIFLDCQAESMFLVYWCDVVEPRRTGQCLQVRFVSTASRLRCSIPICGSTPRRPCRRARARDAERRGPPGVGAETHREIADSSLGHTGLTSAAVITPATPAGSEMLATREANSGQAPQAFSQVAERSSRSNRQRSSKPGLSPEFLAACAVLPPDVRY